MSDADTEIGDVPFAPSLEAEKLAALAEFAAGAGHEINNPLAVISGRAQLLLASETDPDRRRDLATIRQQAVRIHEMISNVMHFARPAQPNLERVSVNQLLNEVVRRLESRTLDARVQIDWRPSAEELFVSGDPTQLAFALSALIDNALDAIESVSSLQKKAPTNGDFQPSQLDEARPVGKIQIKAASLRGEVAIQVADDGPGFGAGVRRHLFDPFFSGRTAGRGLGMGLAKCWRIVNLHGGRIDVSSQPGSGATFTIVLPRESTGRATGTRTPKKVPTQVAKSLAARSRKKKS